MSETVQVECYSGYTYAQEPRAVEWHGQRYEVKRIARRWRTPQGPGFRVEVVRTSNLQHLHPCTAPLAGQGCAQAQVSPISGLVDLTYLEIEDKWTMTVSNLIQEDQR
jgi:hypothetical protein